MRQVQLGSTTYSDLYRTYTTGGGNSCPSGSGAFVDESLSNVLSLMNQMITGTRNSRPTVIRLGRVKGHLFRLADKAQIAHHTNAANGVADR